MSASQVLQLQRLAGNSATRAFAQTLPKSATSAGLPECIGPQGPYAPVQRHSSWEHKLLGDVSPAALQVITKTNEFANKPWYEKVLRAGGTPLPGEQAAAVHALQEQLNNLKEWQSSPPSPGQGSWKGMTIVTIKFDSGDEIACSLGEVNSLADYFGNLEHLKRSKKDTVVKILQTIRRDSWVKLQGVLAKIDPDVAKGMKEPKFEGALTSEGALRELGVERLTMDKNNKASETYLSNANRNACHFAPQSWYRWKEYHEKARTKAKEAHEAKQKADGKDNDSLKKVASELANEAILTNGFGDHYLQDSFASGHLINKTLIMQWFIEWMGQQNLAQKLLEKQTGVDTSKGGRYLKDWDRVKRMTTKLQGKLAGIDLYDKPAGGQANDPQSAEEQASKADRIARLRLEGKDQEQAYGDYLAMIDNAAIQWATKVLHDHFCKNGLEVMAGGTLVGKVFGDDNMIKGGEGVGFSAETAKISQKAITDLIEGTTPPTSEEIMKRFPDHVKIGGEVISFKEWHTGGKLKAFCEKEIFPQVHYIGLGRISPGLGKVSKDLPGGTDVAVDPKEKVDELIDEVDKMLPDPADIEKQIDDKLKELEKKAEGLWESGKKTAGEAWDDASQAASDLWESGKKTVGETWDEASEATSKTFDEGKKRLIELKDELPKLRLDLQQTLQEMRDSPTEMPDAEMPALAKVGAEGDDGETAEGSGQSGDVEGPF